MLFIITLAFLNGSLNTFFGFNRIPHHRGIQYDAVPVLVYIHRTKFEKNNCRNFSLIIIDYRNLGLKIIDKIIEYRNLSSKIIVEIIEYRDFGSKIIDKIIEYRNLNLKIRDKIIEYRNLGLKIIESIIEY